MEEWNSGIMDKWNNGMNNQEPVTSSQYSYVNYELSE